MLSISLIFTGQYIVESIAIAYSQVISFDLRRILHRDLCKHMDCEWRRESPSEGNEEGI